VGLFTLKVLQNVQETTYRFAEMSPQARFSKKPMLHNMMIMIKFNAVLIGMF